MIPADKARAFVMNELGFVTLHMFGGNSPCVQIDAGSDGYLVCDLGSGARAFAQHMMRTHGPAKKQPCHFDMQWDYIMGFALFAPIYIPGNRVIIYGCHEELEAAFRRQHAPPSYPVEFDQLASKAAFVSLKPGVVADICGLKVLAMLHAHGGGSYCYRFECAGKSFVYSTDSEYKQENSNEAGRLVDFVHDADLVIFDSMYSLADAVSVKSDWGHSSNIVRVELYQLAGARRLHLFHHEPMFGDQVLLNIWRETQRFEEITRPDDLPLEILSAYDGLKVVL